MLGTTHILDTSGRLASELLRKAGLRWHTAVVVGGSFRAAQAEGAHTNRMDFEGPVRVSPGCYNYFLSKLRGSYFY